MTITMNPYYVFYVIGAALTLLGKWLVYVRNGQKKYGSTLREATAEWFFEKSAENYGSWVATIAAVWAGGVLYVEQLPFPYLDGLLKLPLHISVACLLGSVMELAAPAFIKWLIRKIPGSGA